MQIVFLYTELAEYTLACFKELTKKKDVELTVIHYPINPEAPFAFDFRGIGTFRCINEFKSDLELQNFIEALQPSIVVSSGWANKWYVKVCRYLNKKGTTTVLTMDNHWIGSWKQRLLTILSPFTLKKAFKKIWVPGRPQVLYAKRLKFKDKDITEGFYCCDTDKFSQYYAKYRDQKDANFPKKLLCVARYVSWKGYKELWDAFIELQEEMPNDWELWCAGTGEQYDQRVEHPKIKHLGFVQKDQWDDIIKETGVFVLASHEEPWGVAVHEFAAAGYPLILSDKIGAGSKFLTTKSGFSFSSGNKEQLKIALKNMMQLDNAALTKIAAASQREGMSLTPENWANTLLNF